MSSGYSIHLRVEYGYLMELINTDDPYNLLASLTKIISNQDFCDSCSNTPSSAVRNFMPVHFVKSILADR